MTSARFKRFSPFLLFLLLPLIFLYGCDSADEITSAQLDLVAAQLPAFGDGWDDTTIGLPRGDSVYTVTFVGADYLPAEDQTTFSYELVNISGPSQSHFFLEQPSCGVGPSSLSPSEGTSTSEIAGFTATKWTISTPQTAEGESIPFSVTYEGEVFLGDSLRVAVKGGNTLYSAPEFFLPGPCQGDFEVSGTVTADGSDRGVAGVPISFKNELGGDVGTAVSGGDGTYSIELTPGRYDVDVHEDFQLISGENIVIGGPDVSDFDFVVVPNADLLSNKIDNRIEGYTVESEDKLPFTPDEWSTIFKQRKGGNATYSESYLYNLLLLVEELAADEPFKFGSDKVADAEAILKTKNPKTDAERLLIELLALELNHVDGRGLQNRDLQLAAIGWAEDTLILEGAFKQGGILGVTSLSDSNDLTYSLNRSGTGGTGGD